MPVPTFGRQISRRRLIGVAGSGGLGLAGAALIGCSSNTKPAPVAPSGQPAAAVSPASVQPKSGGIWRTHLQNEPTNIDIVTEVSANVAAAHNPVYSRLLTWKTGPGIVPASVLQADAAKSWESPDGKTWTFKLQDNLKFHPKPPLNGRVADSEDVKTSYEKFIKVSANRQGLQSLVDRVETPDKNTIVFRLKESYAAFPEVLTDSQGLFVYSKEANAGQIDVQKIEGAIGTGPWMWKSRQPSVALEYERHPEWHIKDAAGRHLPYMAGWRLPIIPEYAQQLAQFAAGQLSTFVPKTDDAEGLIQRVSKVQVEAEPAGEGQAFFAFHHKTAANPMRDVRLRRAWSMAIDKVGLMELFGQFEKAKKLGYQLEGKIGNFPIGTGLTMQYWYLDPFSAQNGPAAQWYAYNPAEAKKLLAAAGYSGQKIIIHTPSPAWLPTLEANIPMLKTVGFNPVINTDEYSQYVGGPYSGKGTWNAAYGNMSTWPTLDQTLDGLLTPTGLRNMSALDVDVPEVPKLYDLVKKQRSATTKEARREIIYDIQRLCGDQMWAVTSVNNRWGTLRFSQTNVRGSGQYKGTQLPSETYPYYWLDA